MFKFTNRAKLLTVLLMVLYWASTVVAPTWFSPAYHQTVFAQSLIRNFAFAPTTTAGTLIAKGSTTQEFFVTNYGVTVATGITSGDAFAFVYGDTTGAANCASNQVTITQTLTAASGVTQFNKEMTPTGNPIIRVPRGHDLCIVANAPAMNVDGYVSGFYQSE